MPWASVKGGLWHETATEAKDFRTPMVATCGITFTPYNVSEGIPRHINVNPLKIMCQKCRGGRFAS